MADTTTITKSPALVRGFSCPPDALAHRLHLVPLGAVPGQGGPVPAWNVLLRTAGDAVTSTVVARGDLMAWARAEGEGVAAHVRRRVAAVEARRPDFAGLSVHRPRIMGILNVTPDSFSDGGRHFAVDDAVRAGIGMLDAGADILDVGGESTRPGADPVSPDEEIRRVVPVIRALAERGARVSIDTRNAAVMDAAVAAGAAIINDVTALEGDPESLRTAARLGVPVVLMHMRGEPRTMQAAPSYAFAPVDVFEYLDRRISACLAAGIARADICVDPGIGFGKTVSHNVQILDCLGLFLGLGCPVLLGLSRKSLIARLSRDESADARLPGSLAGALLGAQRGAGILRVHDVAETAQALAVFKAVEKVSQAPAD